MQSGELFSALILIAESSMYSHRVDASVVSRDEETRGFYLSAATDEGLEGRDGPSKAYNLATLIKKKSVNHRMRLLFIPSLMAVLMIVLWLTRSKTVVKSTKIRASEVLFSS